MKLYKQLVQVPQMKYMEFIGPLSKHQLIHIIFSKYLLKVRIDHLKLLVDLVFIQNFLRIKIYKDYFLGS
jgi:hypothetical protein